MLFPGLVDRRQGYIVVQPRRHRRAVGLEGVRRRAARFATITCAVQWVADQQQFKDPCTGKTYPADGTGLTQYKVSINPTAARDRPGPRQSVPATAG